MMEMIHRRQRLTLPAASTGYLLEELKALSRSSLRDQHRRLGRTSITFRPCRKGRDSLPDQPVGLDAFKLLAIGYGWREGRRGPRPTITLGIYRARFDGSARVPIQFRAEEVHDLLRPRSLTEPHPNLTSIRSGLLLHQAVADGDPSEFPSGADWPRFFYSFEAARVPEFAIAPPFDASASERLIEGLRAWPAELFVGSRRELLQAFPPSQVFASLAHLKGREIRNPAFGVLVRHGLLPRFQDYRTWLGTVSECRVGVRVFQNPGLEGSEASRLRRLIESHVLADRSREESMLVDLETACVALGMRFSEEGPERVDQLAELLDNPWWPASVPYATRVQRVRLSSPTMKALGDEVSRVELERAPMVIGSHPERRARPSPARS